MRWFFRFTRARPKGTLSALSVTSPFTVATSPGGNSSSLTRTARSPAFIGADLN